MYNILKRMYENKRIDAEKLHWYVDKGLITEEQYKEIVAE